MVNLKKVGVSDKYYIAKIHVMDVELLHKKSKTTPLYNKLKINCIQIFFYASGMISERG